MNLRSLFVLATLACAFHPDRADGGPFAFLHITDTHVSRGKNVTPLKETLNRETLANTKPAFIVNTGDVTELGTTPEFDAYKEAIAGAPIPIFAVPGNHDVRWAPLGKEAFTLACGPLYRSFDFGGCHFILLDSTVVLEHWGHFDGAQMKWLADDLRKTGSKKPVFLFFHHWLGREGTNIDNADELLRLIEPYNVVAAFVGHGHSDLHWTVNGLECFMAKGLYQGSYHEVVVAEGTATVIRHATVGGSPVSKTISTIPLSRPPMRRYRLAWDAASTPTADHRRFRLRPLDRPAASDTSARATWNIVGTSLSGTAAVDTSGQIMAEIDVSGLESGWHTLEVQITRPDDNTRTIHEWFRHEPARSSVRQMWEGPTESTIQGSPTLSGDMVLVGSFDGSVYCFRAANGRLLWRRRTGGSIFSTPIVYCDAVLIASMDHRLYCLDRRSGAVRWSYDAGSPLFATAAVADDVACIGANGAIHGVELATGKPLWRVPTGSFFQSRAATAEGVFVLGGWDNTLYAIKARDGSIVWKQPMGRTDGGRGRLSFYYSPAIASPTIANGRVYVCTNDGLLHCLALHDGSEQWAVRAPAGQDTLGYSSPMVANGRVFVGGLGENKRGNCYAFDAETGKLIWNTRTGADNYDSSPALVGPWIAIGSVAGRVTWLDPSDGRIVAAYSLRPGYSFSTPTGTASQTFMASMNGRLTALTTPTHEL
jgi:outer membrane protein assembly factor BamB